MGSDRSKLIRVLLLGDVIFKDSRLSITGLNFLARLLVINLRIRETNLILRGISLDSKSITLIGVEVL